VRFAAAPEPIRAIILGTRGLQAWTDRRPPTPIIRSVNYSSK
jgi:hypothetical protein